MRILIACERSGVVRDAFRARGHDAWSCDLVEDEHQSPYHLFGDVFGWIKHTATPYNLLIAHPPCTYLCSSGLHWNKRIEGREAKTAAALEFALALWQAPVDKVCIENPVGKLGPALRARHSDQQIIHPWQFGHDASKTTCLFTRGLPPLTPTHLIHPRTVNGKPRWANQTDSGQNRLGPSPTRWMERSRTYQGIADAMATQWG